jgi:hypothetical protein
MVAASIRNALQSPLGQRAIGRGLLVTALLLAVGCGGSSLDVTVSASKLKDMSRQGQLWVYDAENGIVVALDRLDEARDEFYRIRRELKLADKRIDAAEKRGKSLGVSVAESWRTHLEALRKWAISRIRVERLGVTTARAAVELAKAQVIQREDLLGGKDFNVKEFADQLQKLQEEYNSRRKLVRKRRRYARRLEGRWRKLRMRYVAQTGDHDSGLWVD